MVRAIILLIIFSLMSILAIFSNTSPSAVSPLIILLVFLLIYTLSLGVTTYILFGFFKAMKLLRKSNKVYGVKEAYLFGSILSIAPVVLLAIQSVAVIGWFDILLVVIFEALANFYIWRRV